MCESDGDKGVRLGSVGAADGWLVVAIVEALVLLMSGNGSREQAEAWEGSTSYCWRGMGGEQREDNVERSLCLRGDSTVIAN